MIHSFESITEQKCQKFTFFQITENFLKRTRLSFFLSRTERAQFFFRSRLSIWFLWEKFLSARTHCGFLQSIKSVRLFFLQTGVLTASFLLVTEKIFFLGRSSLGFLTIRRSRLKLQKALSQGKSATKSVLCSESSGKIKMKTRRLKTQSAR